MAEVKQLRVFVQEEGRVPKVCELDAPVGVTWQDLSEAVSEVVLGPADERWTKVKETRQEDINPDNGGGTITVTSTWKAHQLHLWTHPHDDCAPCASVAPQEVPPAIDLYRMFDPDYPPPKELATEADLAAWWAGMARGRNALRPLLLKRLVSKVSLPGVYTWLEDLGEGEDAYQMQRKETLPHKLREKVVLEGVKGLLELCADRDWAMRLNQPCLQSLVDTLQGGMPAPMEIAAKAVWSLAALAAPRAALVQLGVVSALCEAIEKAVWLRKQIEAAREADEKEPVAAPVGTTLEVVNRVVHACLSALALLVIDANARQAALKVSPSLDLLLQLSDLQFIVPEPVLPAPLPMSVSTMPSDFNEQPPGGPTTLDEPTTPTLDTTLEAAAAPDVVAIAAPARSSGETGGAGPEGGAGEETAKDGEGEERGEGVEEEEGEERGTSPFLAGMGAGHDIEDEEEVVEHALAPEDDPRVHQQIAAEVLWAMLGRDREVRTSLARAGALPRLMALCLSPNPGVSTPAVLCLAAYGHDSGAAPANDPMSGVSKVTLRSSVQGSASIQGSSSVQGSSVRGSSVQGSEAGGGGVQGGGGRSVVQGLDEEAVQGPGGMVVIPAPVKDQYGHLCDALSQHLGVTLLVDSNQAYSLINDLAEKVQELILAYSDGHLDLSPDHSLLSVMEGACTALWVAVAAQLVQERRAPLAEAVAGINAAQKVVPVVVDRAAAVAAALGKQAPAPPPAAPAVPLGWLSWRSVSKLARLTGQLVALLQAAQEEEDANGGGAHSLGHEHSHASTDQPTGSNRHRNPGPEKSVNAVPSTRTEVAYLTGSLYCLMASLAAVHASPLLLRRVHGQLENVVAAIAAARQQEADALQVLETHKDEVAVRRQTSKFYYYEDDEAETERLEKVLEEIEQRVDTLVERKHELEDSLQAACEESVAVAQDTLRCLWQAHPRVGAVQLAAAAVLSTMAQAGHPMLEATLEDPSQVFKGTFRPLLMESNVLPDLLNLARSSCCDAPHIATPTRLLVANAGAHLLATEEPVGVHLLVACCAYLGDPNQPAAAGQHLAAMLWCLARHEENRKAMLTEGSWGGLLVDWLRTGLRVLRRNHALLQGVAGFFTPSPPHHGPVSSDSTAIAAENGFDNGFDETAANGEPAAAVSAPALASRLHVLEELLSSLPGDLGAEVGEEVADSVAAAEAAIRQVRFSLMSLWLMLRQWLVEHMSPMNTLTTSEGLHVRSNTSWWTLKFTIDTPLPLTEAAEDGLALLAQVAAALPDTDGSPAALLRELALRSAWNLSVAHPVVAARLVELGLPDLLLATASSPTAGSRLVRTSLAYVMHLTTLAEHVPVLGGLVNVACLLCGCVERALSSSVPGTAGVGVDVELLEDAARGLARLGLSQEGRAALKKAKAVRWLVAIVRVDNEALEAVIARRRDLGIPAWDRTAELVCPLRAVNGIPITLYADQSAATGQIARKAMADAGMAPPPPPAPPATASPAGRRPASASPDGSDNGSWDTEEDGVEGPGRTFKEPAAACGDAEVGLMALWGLLNLSGYAPAQVALCKHGLYTLLRAVHRSADPLRSSTAAAVLANIHFHPDNATTLYRAELKLKHAALMQLQGMTAAERARPVTSKGRTGGQSLDHGLRAASARGSSRRGPSQGGSRPGTASGRPGTAGSGGGAGGPAASKRLANSIMSETMAALQDLDNWKLDQLQRPGSISEGTPNLDTQPASSPPPLQGSSQGGEDDTVPERDPEAERAYQEARLSFLQWVVDPGAQAFAALDQLSAGNDGMSRDELMTRLTRDPEELSWIDEVAHLQDFFDNRHAQGSFLRGTFSRSLAEGAASLWHTRKPGGRGAAGSAHKHHAHHHHDHNHHNHHNHHSHGGDQGHASRPSTAPTSRRQSKGSVAPGGRPGQQAGAAVDPIEKPGCDAWRPHILAFVQETMDKPQVYLAQRLLVAATPGKVVDSMTGLAVKLFGNQVLTEGIKAMEERAAAEEAFRAAVEQAAKEERERMEAEARVVDLVRFDSAGSKLRGLSRAVSMAVARTTRRELSRAASRRVSRAVSRAVSRRVSNAMGSGSETPEIRRGSKTGGTNGTGAGTGVATATQGKTPRAPRAGGGVRFGGDVEGATEDAVTAGAEEAAGDEATDAALAAAAAALMKGTRGGEGDYEESAGGASSRKTGASFIAGALVQAGALSTLPGGRAPGTTRVVKPPSGSDDRKLGRNSSRTSTLAGRDAALSRSLTQGRSSLETKWLGEDVRRSLARPTTGYHRPHLGAASPAGTLVSRLKSERYQELQDMLYPERAKIIRPVSLSDNVARPEAVLYASVEDVVTLGALREAVASAGNFNRDAAQNELVAAEASVSAALPISVKVATGDGGPDKVYRFPRDTSYDPRHIVMFQHIEGAMYCQSLYGHYLLPNGKLAHFVLGDTVRKGHQVDLEAPPDIPFSPDDWLSDGLPTTTTFTEWGVPHAPHTRVLLSPLWCPVPNLAAPPQEGVIEWQDGARGGNLVLKSVCLTATLDTIQRVDEEVTVVEPTIKKPKKKAAAAAAKPGATAAAAPPPGSPKTGAKR